MPSKGKGKGTGLLKQRVDDHEKRIVTLEDDRDTLADFVADVAETIDVPPPKKRARRQPAARRKK